MNISNYKADLIPSYSESLLLNTIGNFTTISSFSEDTWVLDKLKRAGQHKGKYSLYFATIPECFMYETKLSCLQRLNERISVCTVGGYITSLRFFYNFLQNHTNITSLENLNKNILDNFVMYLDEAQISKGSKESHYTNVRKLMLFLVEFDYIEPIKSMGRNNPFSRTNADRRKDEKYLPQYIVNQLDKVFDDKSVSVELRTIYWICRLIPSRINEVLGIPRNCLRMVGNEYVLTLRMYKQNGGYIYPEERMIGLKYSDMGKYLIDLINEQKAISEQLSEYASEELKDFLFLRKRTYKNINKITGQYEIYHTDLSKPRNINLVSDSMFRHDLLELVKKYDVRDEKGNLYNMTSHQLRHNAITDRIYENFTLLEIKDLTHHKTTQMIAGAYVHPDKEELKKISKIVTNSSSEETFRGKIINPSTTTTARLLKMPRSHVIGRLGICSDITSCKSEIFECLNCSNFEPNEDELEYFEEQVKQWEEKEKLFANNPYMLENIRYNKNLNINIIKRIKGDINE